MDPAGLRGGIAESKSVFDWKASTCTGDKGRKGTLGQLKSEVMGGSKRVPACRRAPRFRTTTSSRARLLCPTYWLNLAILWLNQGENHDGILLPIAMGPVKWLSLSLLVSLRTYCRRSGCYVP